MNSSLFITVFLLLCWLSLCVCRDPVCIGSERETLLKFKHHLKDPSNRLSSWNATANSNCCHWDGVVCNNITSHIAELHLNTPPPTFDDGLFPYFHELLYEELYEEYSRLAFGGEINPCLVDLKHLNYLDFSGNRFGSIPIPSFIATITSLTHLNLSNAGFMGNIPPHFGNLSNLLYLDLSDNELLGGGMPIPSFVGRMTTLIYLDLSYSGFMGNIPPQIGNLSNLAYLDLSRNLLLGGGMPIPSFVGTMTTLIHLDLSSSFGFTGNIPPQIGNLSNLAYLDLSRNLLLGGGMPIPSFVGTMTTLIHLDLSYSGFMGNIPPQIGNLSNLAYLGLRYVFNGTIPSQFGNLSNLLYLDLTNYEFMIENIDWLSSLSKIEYLDLGGANLSRSFQWLHTLQHLPSLMHLHLSKCTLPRYNQPSFLNFSSLLTLDLSYTFNRSSIIFIPKWVFGQKKLVSLTLRFNNFKGLIPDGLRNLTLLENLNLNQNIFSSSIPDWFYGSFPHLKFLDLSFNILQGTIPNVLKNLTSLIALDLSYNQLEGSIPTSLGNVTSLIALDLSHNQLEGPIGELPRSLEKLSSLRTLILSSNQLSGNPFESLRSLSKLSLLDIGDNYFQGIVKECHLENLTNLNSFYASRNNLTLKVSPNWHPTFQLTDLDMTSWQLGPNFPSWIQSQNNTLQYIMMSNTGISDFIPSWFWVTFSQANLLNLSHNHIQGEIGTTLTNSISIYIVDISANNLCGKLPSLSSGVGFLDLSGNSFSKSMEDFLCKNQDKQMELEFLNLASNNLSGGIPDCWAIWPYLVDVNLQSNNFVGNFPQSMGSLTELQSLRIRKNLLSGTFPTILKKTNKLILLDLGENNFSGTIPAWVGESLLDMKVLILRSNRFFGHIPDKICDMSLLQVLDIAGNNLTGNIPTCFNNLKAMTEINKFMVSHIICSIVNYTHIYLDDSIVGVLLWLKGRGDEYKNFLGLVTSIDLSNNNLTGEIPREITDLNELRFLNFSHNQLSGHIPRSIGNMGSLLSIDFSRNHLSGEIPSTISNLNFLSMLDLSYNHLKGKIPIGNQLQTFDASNFIGNNLCGPPLPINCSSSVKITNFDFNDKGSNKHGVNWFFVSMTFGFVMGFWIVVGPLFICRSWRYAYFHFLDHLWFKLQFIL